MFHYITLHYSTLHFITLHHRVERAVVARRALRDDARCVDALPLRAQQVGAARRARAARRRGERVDAAALHLDARVAVGRQAQAVRRAADRGVDPRVRSSRGRRSATRRLLVTRPRFERTELRTRHARARVVARGSSRGRRRHAATPHDGDSFAVQTKRRTTLINETGRSRSAARTHTHTRARASSSPGSSRGDELAL